MQWGGQADYLIGTPLAVNGKLPTSFQDYISMITGRYPDALQNDRFTDFDGTNRIGNHVGSYDIALEWNGSTANWLLYHQHLYEDASGLAMRNVPDGLTGLRYKNQRKTAVNRFRVLRMVVEWLSTTNQSGPTFDPTAQFQGGDNYFNHSQYRQGWSYQGHTLGTPLLVPYTDMRQGSANLGGPYFPNNRLVAWYTGFEGSFRKGPTVTLRASYSRNLGTFNQPYLRPLYQLSTMLAVQWPLNKRANTLLMTSLALDRGELLPNAVGGFIRIQKIMMK